MVSIHTRDQTPNFRVTHTHTRTRLPAVLLHHQDLDHADKDVEEVELEGDALVDGVLGEAAGVRQAGVVQHLLHVVQGEAAEDGEAAVQPEVLGEGERAHGRGGQEHGGETGDGDDGGAGEEGTADVQVLLLLSGGTDDGQGAHHGNRVGTGAGEQRHGDKGEHGSDKSGLGGVESCPEGVLGNVAENQRVSIPCSNNKRNAVSLQLTYQG